MKLIIHALKAKLENIDPLITPIQVLNNLNQPLQPLINEVSAFNGNKNVGHLTNANGHAENILVYLPNVLSPMFPADIDGLKDSIISFRRSTGQLTKNMEAEFNRLNENFNSLIKRLFA